MKKYFLLLSVISTTIGLSACCYTNAQRDFEMTQSSQANNLEIGTMPWYEWVESKVHIADAHGHGPDTGESEWCSAVEARLFNRKSGLVPCSVEWNEKVNASLAM